MTEPRLHHVQCLDNRGLRRMAYWEWGDPANPRLLLCAHGLARQGRDFDTFAAAMCDEYRVVAPDVVGRGQSEWLPDPMAYQVPTYVSHMVTLLARLNAQTVHWVGTSMGGLIGMGLASLPNNPVSKLVLNDVGPVIEPVAVSRIAAYVGQPWRWATVEEAADYLRTISTGFGTFTREQWLALTRPMLKPDGDGFKLHYDPAIGVAFKGLTPELIRAGEAMAWQAYEAIRCPTMLLRGADSDLLSHETALAMGQRGPKAKLQEFAGVGHAPMLIAPEQIAVVREFLLSP